MFDVLDFNPALKVMSITLAYENHENDIDFRVAEMKDGLKMDWGQHAKFLHEKTDNRFLKFQRNFND